MSVVLFRTPAEGDVYTPTFADAGYRCVSVPALAERLVTDELRGILARGAEEWEASVITSRRAADAWVQAARGLSPSSSSDPSTFEPWSNVSVYSPGPAVRTVLDASDLPPAFLPSHSVTATCAAELAPLILAAPPRPPYSPVPTPPPSSPAQPEPPEDYRPYLVLTGDKTLPLLTDTLVGAERRVVRVRVYETREADKLAEDVRGLPERLKRRDGGTPWVAIFSPSSGSYVLPHLVSAGYAVRAGDGKGLPLRVAAIGATTDAALREGGWRVDAVAVTPDAPGLVAAIRAADAA